VGLNSEISYVLWDFLGVGIGSGFEKLNQPHFNYVPLYLTTTLFAGSEFFFDIYRALIMEMLPEMEICLGWEQVVIYG